MHSHHGCGCARREEGHGRRPERSFEHHHYPGADPSSPFGVRRPLRFLAWKLGLRLSWSMDDGHGGASGLNLLQHAVAAKFEPVARPGVAELFRLFSYAILYIYYKFTLQILVRNSYP